MKKKEVNQDEFWSEGYFAQTMSSEDMKKKMRTFHMKHDEEMDFNCKKCSKKISAHNKDWHDGMCDNCFNEKYYPDNSPEKDPFSEANSKGICRLCSKEFSGKEIKKHIAECLKNSKEATEAFLLKASEGPFWVYFSVPKNKKLVDIDNFLRDLWLECCGHLSAFEIGKIRYMSDDSELEDNEKGMDARIDKSMEFGTKVHYEYDFGTATELELECISAIKTDSKNIAILARNNLPDFRCEICNAKAEEVCVQCIWEGEGFVCKKCSKKHKCEEPYFLPIVNSPRMGMCGFTGEECKLLNS